MTTAQKLIKYIALGFAAFLIVTIISLILNGGYALLSAFGLMQENVITEDLKVISSEVKEVSTLKIDLSFTNLDIKTGDIFKVETNNSKITFENNNGSVKIKEKNINWLSNNNRASNLTIYIPEDMPTIDETNIETGAGKINIEELVRQAVKEIGYDNEETDMDYRTCKVNIEINKQSPDIAMGVDIGGAGDQGIMFGYACDETEEYMPYAIWLAHKLAKKLADVRKSKEIDYLRPDGKTQVTVEYENDKPKRIEAIVISNQHNADVDIKKLRKDIYDKVIMQVVEKNMIDENTKIYINPTGRFVIGGPLGDTGLTRKKNNNRYIWWI